MPYLTNTEKNDNQIRVCTFLGKYQDILKVMFILSLPESNKDQLTNVTSQIGHTIPPIICYENCAPPIPVNVRDLFVNARLGILFGLPGAFTPVCSTVSAGAE